MRPHPRPGIRGAHSSPPPTTHTTSGHTPKHRAQYTARRTCTQAISHAGYPTHLSRTGAHILACVTVTCPPADTYETQHALSTLGGPAHHVTQHITNSRVTTTCEVRFPPAVPLGHASSSPQVPREPAFVDPNTSLWLQ